MDNAFIDFIKKYRWLLVPALPFVLFLILTISLFVAPREKETGPALTPTLVPSPTLSFQLPTLRPELVADGYDVEIDEPLEERPDFIRREPETGTLPDGTVTYMFNSPNRTRPNIIITQGENVVAFQRNMIDPENPVEISDFVDIDGQPDRIIQGSRFYGKDSQIFVYARLGYAFIADPEETGMVLEQHLFPPMTVDEYIARYRQ